MHEQYDFKAYRVCSWDIRLRPGHLVGRLHINTLVTILDAELDLTPLFLQIAEKKLDYIQIRYRIFPE